jgi:hypothetical protein
MCIPAATTGRLAIIAEVATGTYSVTDLRRGAMALSYRLVMNEASAPRLSPSPTSSPRAQSSPSSPPPSDEAFKAQSS